MKYLVVLFIVIPSLFSCKNKKDTIHVSDKRELLEVDREFSRMSEEKGMKNAFIEYIDSNGVLLRPGQMPIIGANAIDYLIQLSDSGFTLTWEPNSGEIARSGELGYTYGIYELKPKAKDTTIYGTYVSIWRKENNGKWKFVLDTGNEGLGVDSTETSQ